MITGNDDNMFSDELIDDLCNSLETHQPEFTAHNPHETVVSWFANGRIGRLTAVWNYFYRKYGGGEYVVNMHDHKGRLIVLWKGHTNDLDHRWLGGMSEAWANVGCETEDVIHLCTRLSGDIRGAELSAYVSKHNAW